MHGDVMARRLPRIKMASIISARRQSLKSKIESVVFLQKSASTPRGVAVGDEIRRAIGARCFRRPERLS